jgi:hypothetical protein
MWGCAVERPTQKCQTFVLLQCSLDLNFRYSSPFSAITPSLPSYSAWEAKLKYFIIVDMI